MVVFISVVAVRNKGLSISTIFHHTLDKISVAQVQNYIHYILLWNGEKKIIRQTKNIAWLENIIIIIVA